MPLINLKRRYFSGVGTENAKLAGVFYGERRLEFIS